MLCVAPCLSADADWCLQLDDMPDSRLQAGDRGAALGLMKGVGYYDPMSEQTYAKLLFNCLEAVRVASNIGRSSPRVPMPLRISSASLQFMFTHPPLHGPNVDVLGPFAVW